MRHAVQIVHDAVFSDAFIPVVFAICIGQLVLCTKVKDGIHMSCIVKKAGYWGPIKRTRLTAL